MAAIPLYIKDQGSESSIERAQKCILDCLWAKFSFGRTEVFADDPEVTTLLQWSEQLTGSGIDFRHGLAEVSTATTCISLWLLTACQAPYVPLYTCGCTR